MIKLFYPRIQWSHLYQPLQPQSESLSISFGSGGRRRFPHSSPENGFIPDSVQG